MSTARQPGFEPSFEPVRAPARDGRRAVIRWRLGREAAREAFGTRSPACLALSVRETPAGWRAQLHLDAPDAPPRLLRDAAPRVRWTLDAERAMLHIDAPAVLHATIDLANDTPAILYARTPLLAELGLRGGRYEPAGAELDLTPRGSGPRLR